MELRTIFENQNSLVDPAGVSAERVRVVLFDCSSTKVLGILRQKPGDDPYVVLPGGGVECDDGTLLDALKRELKEELDLDAHKYSVSNKGVFLSDGFGKQFYFFAAMRERRDEFGIHGPEASRDAMVSGTYAPQWFELSAISGINLVPKHIKDLLLRGWEYAQGSTASHD